VVRPPRPVAARRTATRPPPRTPRHRGRGSARVRQRTAPRPRGVLAHHEPAGHLPRARFLRARLSSGRRRSRHGRLRLRPCVSPRAPDPQCRCRHFRQRRRRTPQGYRLYSGIYDNKTPFFYYTDAIALKIVGWRGPFLIDVFWLSLAAWSIWLLLRAIGASRLIAAVGYVAYPMFLSGAWYHAGYPELPALALAPLIPALWARGVPAGAGTVFCVALFYRPDYALIMLGLLGAVIVSRAPARLSVGPLRVCSRSWSFSRAGNGGHHGAR
jgi:hypothetical protein